jgi:hypothetical protein
MMWSEGDGDEGAMMANVDCIYAAESKRQMPNYNTVTVLRSRGRRRCISDIKSDESWDCYLR